jgi:signal transduction histidine kinase
VADPSARSLLIVDDNSALADNLREVLEDAGYKVRLATTCAEAEERADGISLALVDVRLPDGDGTVLARRLKERAPDVEVILLTGFATLESAVGAVRAGAWAYLVKPCSIDDLLLTVRQAARQVALTEEKRELGRRAMVAEKLAAVGTLAAGLSHEIRNPLNAASLQLVLLERRLRRLPSEQQPQLLEPLSLVQQEIKRLNQIVEDFLQFARPREFVPAPVDLSATVSSVLALLAVQAERAELRIDKQLEKVRNLDGNAGLLQQAIMNLVLNAIQATPPGGFVRVEVGERDGAVVLAVEDSGPGVPPAIRERIFEPFFTTKESGSGLGLPLVHSIVLQHQGSISLQDGRTGGARFVMEFPSQAPAAPGTM